MPFQKGNKDYLLRQNPNPEVRAANRHLHRLFAMDIKNLTVDDIRELYRDKKGKIIRNGLLEFLKLILHHWPDGFSDPDAKPEKKDITIRVEVVAPPGKPGSKAMAPSGLVTSTLKVMEE